MLRSTLTLAAAAVAFVLSAAVAAGPVNINTADVATLATELKGVGDTTARAIVAYREQHGPFRHPADLQNVKGVGPRILELNREHIRIEDAEAARDDG